MEREDRYLIIKRKDIGAYLTAPEEEALNDISRKINRHRLMDGKSALTAVVVEHDWPEYGPTWAAIEKRMDGESSAAHTRNMELLAINEALELLHIAQSKMGPDRSGLDEYDRAHWDRISKCLQGLEKFQQQQPVAWSCDGGGEEADEDWATHAEEAFNAEQAKTGGMPYGTYGGF